MFAWRVYFRRLRFFLLIRRLLHALYDNRLPCLKVSYFSRSLDSYELKGLSYQLSLALRLQLLVPNVLKGLLSRLLFDDLTGILDSVAISLFLHKHQIKASLSHCSRLAH